MASYNRVILVGNLTRDIELRYTPGGTAVMDNALAVNDRRKTASGEWVEEATFVVSAEGMLTDHGVHTDKYLEHLVHRKYMR